MAQFRMSTIEIDKIVADKARGPISIQFALLRGAKTPRKAIEAKKVTEIIPLIDEYQKELATIHPDKCFRIFVDIANGCRKPPGFDAATKRGGPLYDRFSNPEIVTVYLD